MTIETYRVTPCIQRQEDPNWSFARGGIPDLRGWVVTLVDRDGREGHGYVHSVPAVSGETNGVRAAVDFLLPGIVGRSIHDLRAISDDMDRSLAHAVTAKAGIEMALFDLLARTAGLPLGTVLGGRFRDTIPQSRILPLKAPAAMAEAAVALADEGYRTLKIKLNGDAGTDRDRVASVRSALGDAVRLTLDPNQSYTAKGMQALFARIERYDIDLIEQPVPAADHRGLAHLTRVLPVPVEADESAASLQDVVSLVRDRSVDVINLKITKLGGIAKTMAAIQICEAGGVGCRFGAAFGPSLLQAVSAHLAATVRRLDHACELAEHEHLLDDPFTRLAVTDGLVTVPDGIGSGVAFREDGGAGAPAH